MEKYFFDRLDRCNYLVEKPSWLRVDNGLSLDSDKIRKKDWGMINAMGLRFRENEPAGWLKINQDVDEHTDGYGRVFLFLASGAMTFAVENDFGRKIIPMTSGFFLTFDDKFSHSVVLESRSVSMLIIPVKNMIPSWVKSDFKLGNF